MGQEGLAMATPILVKAAFDPDAGVWFVESSDLPGLNLESETLDGLRERLPGAVADLLEAAGRKDELGVPIELIAPRLRSATAAVTITLPLAVTLPARFN